MRFLNVYVLQPEIYRIDMYYWDWYYQQYSDNQYYLLSRKSEIQENIFIKVEKSFLTL